MSRVLSIQVLQTLDKDRQLRSLLAGDVEGNSVPDFEVCVRVLYPDLYSSQVRGLLWRQPVVLHCGSTCHQSYPKSDPLPISSWPGLEAIKS